MRIEIKMLENFTDNYLEKINRTIREREQAEKAALREYVLFTAKMLNNIAAEYMYDVDMDYMKRALRNCAEYPGIAAIKVTDAYGEPFGAVWKTTDIDVGDALPQEIKTDESLSVELESFYDRKKMGTIKVYYSEASLEKEIEMIRKKAGAEAKAFERDSHSYLNNVFVTQGIWGIFILTVQIFCLIFVLRILVLRPLESVSDIARSLTDFDLSVCIATKRKDEIGRLLNAMNNMVSEFRKIVSDVKSKGNQLAHASRQMTANINVIASAAAEMSVSAENVSRTAEQVSQNVNAVAGSIGDMSASLNALAKETQEGSRVTGRGVNMARKAKDTMTSLGHAAARIGQVTETIKQIADKTALLALNADIEAASAGDAGKGFAVVANEIKEFARQSTHAAEDIIKRISFMQTNTGDAVEVISDVSDVIDKINRSSETVHATLENQMKGAGQVASNAAQANIRSREIALSMEELAKAVDEVSRSVGQAARGIGTDTESPHIEASAAVVAKLAGELLDLVDKFKVK